MKFLSKPRRKRKDTAQDCQAEYFASQFNTYDETIISYRCGGYIPSRQDFDRAKLNNKNPLLGKIKSPPIKRAEIIANKLKNASQCVKIQSN